MAYIYQLGKSIDQAVAMVSRSNDSNGDRPPEVAAIIPVQGIPFYGFHAAYTVFLKVYLLHPTHQSRIVELLNSGAIMGKTFDVYDAHLSYLAQFMVDYNLLGMDYLEFADVRFRLPIREDYPRSLSHAHLLSDATVPESMKWPTASQVARQTYSELEFDAWAIDIINRRRIPERPDMGVIDPEKPRAAFGGKLVPSLASLWEDELKRRKARGLPTDSLNELPPSQTARGKVVWKSEHAIREQISELCSKAEIDTNFKFPQRLEGFMTAFASATALYDDECLLRISKDFDSNSNVVLNADIVKSQSFEDPHDNAANEVHHEINEGDQSEQEDDNDNADAVPDFPKEDEEPMMLTEPFVQSGTPQRNLENEKYFTKSITTLWSPNANEEAPHPFTNPPLPFSPDGKDISLPSYHCGIILVQDEAEESWRGNGLAGMAPKFPRLWKLIMATDCFVEVCLNERDLFHSLIDIVRKYDPDISVGYEIHSSSWGYAVERAMIAYDLDLTAELARVKCGVKTKFGRKEDPYGFSTHSAISASGRIFLNVWRLMKSEVTLTSYSLESTVFHIIHKRIPKFSPTTLTQWYSRPLSRWRTLKHYIERTHLTLQLLQDTSLISRTSEFARVYGIDFYSVLWRGSQFKVESIMTRISKPENYIMISANAKEIREMRAIDCLPLILEPKSTPGGVYRDPLAVMDFQSLYPSVMIAYNYCFSTCLGRAEGVGGSNPLGVLKSYTVPLDVFTALKDDLIVTPNGLLFVKPKIREGTLGRMLTEILNTRQMVKQSMKLYKGDKGLLRILEARQLSLKLIANVTYGYAGASFTGRMPCSDVADAIVQTGRASLEFAMELVKRTPAWGGEVVYGDTDSDAIARAVTLLNPEPMKLKFEKVFTLSKHFKKRYVGFMFESPNQVEPGFDAKGIETVRRDGCPAVAKTLEQTLK
ncbi:DNA polymerase zeta [Irineochytrium annulatum]|nr:DNA polymerase zeta [Irineochytrium annulatum]